jgi:hypothetical protein
MQVQNATVFSSLHPTPSLLLTLTLLTLTLTLTSHAHLSPAPSRRPYDLHDQNTTSPETAAGGSTCQVGGGEKSETLKHSPSRSKSMYVLSFSFSFSFSLSLSLSLSLTHLHTHIHTCTYMLTVPLLSDDEFEDGAGDSDPEVSLGYFRNHISRRTGRKMNPPLPVDNKEIHIFQKIKFLLYSLALIFFFERGTTSLRLARRRNESYCRPLRI